MLMLISTTRAGGIHKLSNNFASLDYAGVDKPLPGCSLIEIDEANQYIYQAMRIIRPHFGLWLGNLSWLLRRIWQKSAL